MSIEEFFFKFIREDVGIIHIYPEQKSYLKKKPTFEERQAKIEQMLEKVEFEDDKLDNDMEAVTKC